MGRRVQEVVLGEEKCEVEAEFHAGVVGDVRAVEFHNHFVVFEEEVGGQRLEYMFLKGFAALHQQIFEEWGFKVDQSLNFLRLQQHFEQIL